MFRNRLSINSSHHNRSFVSKPQNIRQTWPIEYHCLCLLGMWSMAQAQLGSLSLTCWNTLLNLLVQNLPQKALRLRMTQALHHHFLQWMAQCLTWHPRKGNGKRFISIHIYIWFICTVHLLSIWLTPHMSLRSWALCLKGKNVANCPLREFS